MNKLENTPENKARFIALHWGQDILIHPGTFNKSKVCHAVRFDNAVVELTPLSQISDEDVKGLTNSFMRTKKELLDYYCSESHGQALKMLFKDLKPEDYDYLRSKGYALPWMGLSV